MHREGKPKGFFYLDHRTVDGKHGLITDTYATPGNVHDSQPYIERLKRQLTQFHFDTVGVGLDAGYFTAPICHLVNQLNIYPVLGYCRPHRSHNTIKKKDFIYDKKSNSYTCPEGQTLTYKTTSREGYRHYHSTAKNCQACPLLSSCTQSKNTKKVITRHIWEKDKEKANEIRLSKWGKKVYSRRKETVERSFADAKQHHGHRYARFRGLANVQMQCLLAAVAQNIKKIALKLFFVHIIRIFISQILKIRKNDSKN